MHWQSSVTRRLKPVTASEDGENKARGSPPDTQPCRHLNFNLLSIKTPNL